MLVKEAVNLLIDRAGVAGDPFYTETDVLAALQTAFEVYYNILEMEGRAEILRRINLTPTSTTTTLPSDVRTIRSVWRNDLNRPLVRIPARSEAFQGEVYDFLVGQSAVQLIIPSGLVNVPMGIEYLPTVPQLALVPTTDPREWTEIPDSLFPISGIIQRAIAELLAKDRDPAASIYSQLAQEHLQSWIASVRSSRQLTVESPSTVRYVIAQVLGLQNKLAPDYANERQIIATIQRAVEAIYRRIEVFGERYFRVVHDQGVADLPATFTTTQPMANVLSVLVNRTTGWWSAAWRDAKAPVYQVGTFYDWSPQPSGSVEVTVWSTDSSAGAANRVLVLGVSPPPTVTATSTLDVNLFPPSLILDFCLSESLQDPARASFHYQRFQAELEAHIRALHDRMIHRDMPARGARSRALAMLRQLMGSAGQGDWAQHVLESFIDMARAEIARRIRSLTQDFFVREIVSPPQPRITPTERWIEVIGVYWYPAGRSSPQFVYELVHGDRHDPAFAWAFGMWDNDGQDIVLSNFPGISSGEIVIRAVVAPEDLAGRLDLSEIESYIYPEDVVVAQAVSIAAASPRAPEALGQKLQVWLGLAERKLSQHVAELARAFRRSVRRRMPPLKLSPPWRGAL